jgi:electron transfer flavoprotein alpha/beta subunit
VLAKALEREGADLILFGQQSNDSDGAVLWAAVAERLKWPVMSQVSLLEVADGTATAKRQTEFGYDRMAAPLPAVVAVSDAVNEPRYPSLKGIMGAKSKPQETPISPRRGCCWRCRLAHDGIGFGSPRRGEAVKIEDDGSGAQRSSTTAERETL